jgi:hypothetical protein
MIMMRFAMDQLLKRFWVSVDLRNLLFGWVWGVGTGWDGGISG